MKKIYSLLLAIGFLSSPVHAKTTGVGIPNIFPHMGSGGGGSSSPSAFQSRIIAYTYLKHDGAAFVPVDSTTYSYSFGRGGQLSKEDMDDNFVNFDESYTYLFNPSSGTYINQYHRSQIFNAANKAQTYTCQNWIPASSTWKDSERFVYSYNGDLTRLDSTSFQIHSGGFWHGHVFYKNLYDINDRLTRMNSTVFTMSFTYDAAGNLVSRVDTQANIVPFYWYLYNKASFTYDASNRVTAYTLEDFRNNKKFRHEYTYSGMDLSVTTEYVWNNNTWEISGRHLFSYDPNHNVTMDEWQYLDVASSSYKSASRKIWTYNNYQQPLTYYSETFEPSNSSWGSTTDDFFYRYYYQPFIPASVNDVANDNEITLYPVPAQNRLSIDISGNTLQSSSILIYDLHGRLVKQQSTTGNNNSINISDLANGTYVLKLSTANKHLSRQFIVAR